jgi:hypothetical protein
VGQTYYLLHRWATWLCSGLLWSTLSLFLCFYLSVSLYLPSTYIYEIYYINVKLPNLDLKLGIEPKAGNLLSGKREGEGGVRETEIEDRDRWEK